MKLDHVFEGQSITDAYYQILKQVHSLTKFLVENNIKHEFLFEDIQMFNKPPEAKDKKYYIRVKIDNPKDMLYTQLNLE